MQWGYHCMSTSKSTTLIPMTKKTININPFTPASKAAPKKAPTNKRTIKPTGSVNAVNQK